MAAGACRPKASLMTASTEPGAAGAATTCGRTEGDGHGDGVVRTSTGAAGVVEPSATAGIAEEQPERRRDLDRVAGGEAGDLAVVRAAGPSPRYAGVDAGGGRRVEQAATEGGEADAQDAGGSAHR